jgi:hypothetical protein
MSLSPAPTSHRPISWSPCRRGARRQRVRFRPDLDLAGAPFRTCCRIFVIWPARFLLTTSCQTARHSQSLWGHFSSRSSCCRRCRTSVLSLKSSASSSIASCRLFLIITNLRPYNSLWCRQWQRRTLRVGPPSFDDARTDNTARIRRRAPTALPLPNSSQPPQPHAHPSQT